MTTRLSGIARFYCLHSFVDFGKGKMQTNEIYNKICKMKEIADQGVHLLSFFCNISVQN